MAGESSKDTAEDQAEAQIDELIRDIFKEAGGFSESSIRGMATTTALLETALGAGRVPTRVSAVERLLLAEAFASELADALAPALAEKLAPRLIKGLEQLMASQAAEKKPATAASSGGAGRKPEPK